jgi:hypothetical protein
MGHHATMEGSSGKQGAGDGVGVCVIVTLGVDVWLAV